MSTLSHSDINTAVIPTVPHSSKLTYLMLATAALGLITSLMYILLTFKEEQEIIGTEVKESLTWHSSQLLHETDNLHRDFTDFHYGKPGITLEEVILRFDILWSRILTVSSGEVGRVYISTAEAKIAQKYGHAMLEKLDPLLAKFEAGDERAYAEISRTLTTALDLFHKAVLATSRTEQNSALERRERFNSKLRELVYALVLGLGSALALVALILRNQFALHDLRKNLEARVEKRTLQLEKSNETLQSEIEERIKAEDELRKLSAAIEQSPASVAVLERNGRISYVNAKFVLQTGIYPRDILGKSIELLEAIYFSGSNRRLLAKAIKAGNQWRGEYQIKNKHGDEFWVDASLAPIRARDGKITHFILIEEDVSLRKQQEKRLQRQAFYDDITNLPNRVLAFDRLTQAITSAHRHKHRAALMFIDLDQFKQINDTLGHFAGDQLLRRAGERFSASLRKEDTVARLGGDEFTIILPQIASPENAERVAEKIQAEFSKPFTIQGQEVFTTTSIGITVYPDDAEDPQALMRNADAAMYQVKDTGRNGFRFFTPAIDDRVKRRVNLESHLRRALDRDEFSLNYQPIIALDTRRVIGAEALLRWNNPALGSVTPDQFIPLAEETGLIIEIGEWVLYSACLAASKWNKLCPYPFRLAVNASSRQFKKGNLVSTVTKALEKSGLPKDCLDIEVTESLMMDSSKEIMNILNELSGIGVQLAIDDFGTGYSSLSYVKNYPFTKLKIDRAFVQDVIEDEEDAALARAILAMAHSLNLDVVGEGVETAEQLEFLQRHDCTYAQGFLFSRPLPADDFEEYLLGHLEDYKQQQLTTTG